MTHKIKRAMVLAAGKGTRLGELTQKTPKPLVDLGHTTPLKRIVSALDSIGLDEIVINCHWLGEQIVSQVEAWQQESCYKAKLIVSYEEELLETAGGIKKALHHFKGEPFFVVNADVVWPKENLQKMLTELEANYNADAQEFLIGLTTPKYSPNPKGDFLIGESGQVFNKPSKDGQSNFSYCCVCVAHPKAFEQVEESFTGLRVVWEKAMERESFYGLFKDLEWVDMGTPEGLEKSRSTLKEIA